MARAVGAMVRRLRQAQDFSFDAFVEETGLGRGYISELERGLVVPSLHSLAKIAKALELTLSDLLVGDSLRERLFVLTRGLDDSAVAELMRSASRMKEAAQASPSSAPKPSR